MSAGSLQQRQSLANQADYFALHALWFVCRSTLRDGQCNASLSGGAGGQPWCVWGVARVVKTVAQACHTPRFVRSIENYGRELPSGTAGSAACYDACLSAAGGLRNTSSPCFIRCIYDTVLGAGSANRATGASLSYKIVIHSLLVVSAAINTAIVPQHFSWFSIDVKRMCYGTLRSNNRRNIHGKTANGMVRCTGAVP